jgi:hypothetical protein
MKRLALWVTLALLCSANAYPAGSKVLKWKGVRELSKATIENIMVDHRGFASLSYGIDSLFESTEIFLWDCDFDSKGNIYVVSGNEGKVFRISPSHQVFTIFSGESGAEIFAVAVDARDNVYIGESPSGIIYRIGKGEKEEEYFTTGEQYIWDLAFDANGRLFAATGDQGKVYRILEKGRGEVYYGSTENHIIRLLFHRGKLYAGTEPNGLFMEIMEKGKAVVHYDTDEDEVRAMVAYEDMIYFSTVNQPLSSGAASYSSFFGPAAMDMPNAEKSTLYRFNLGTKSVLPLWDCVTPPIYTIAAHEDGRVLIGAEGGKLYYVTDRGKVGFVNQVGDAPVLTITPEEKGEGFIILTGNLGNVIRMGPDLAKVGTMESHVIDTESRSLFGHIDWNVDVPTGTQFTVWIRVGNRENPDEDWSRWKQMRRGAAIDLGPARFIQIKCELRTASSGKSPLFKDISISYLPENRAPSIYAVVVCPVGVNASEAYDPYGGAKMPLSEKDHRFYVDLGYDLPPSLYMLEKGKRCAVWQAADPDGDSLMFTFFYRGEKEKEWKELKKEIMQPSVIWDETAFPDGTYRTKVEASDRWNNPPDRAREVEMESEPFTVDNFSPLVEVTSIRAQGNSIHIGVTAEDELSLLKDARYSVNAGEWQAVLPEDGIFDNNRETFSVTIENREPGEYTIVFKVVDLALNTGSGKATTEIK